jgi:hypothetical protein
MSSVRASSFFVGNGGRELQDLDLMEEFGDAQLVVFRQLHNHFFQARNLGLQGTDVDLGADRRHLNEKGPCKKTLNYIKSYTYRNLTPGTGPWKSSLSSISFKLFLWYFWMPLLGYSLICPSPVNISPRHFMIQSWF